MVLKSEKGAAMVMVILVGLVATVLGTSLFHVSKTNAAHVQRNADQIQANYFARSGVDIAIGMINNGFAPEINQEEVYYGTLDSPFVQDETNDYTIKFGITLDENNHYIINSLGVVRRGTQAGSEAQSAESALQFSFTPDGECWWWNQQFRRWAATYSG
ncbi:MAG: hypothetical protein U9N81_12365 [Bacillota bacterium]|nr:hypothetical protein [Bacillota bacterium]